MLIPLPSIKKLIRSWFIPWKGKTTRNRPAGIWLGLEFLEERLAPATISDGGTTTLNIVLGTNENLSIVSNGTSYAFTSNQKFTAASGTDPANQSAAFGGLGTLGLTLTSAGMSQYSAQVNITDTGIGDSVTFNYSAYAYSNNFNVALANSLAGAISFNGNSNFGNFNLRAATTLDILVNTRAAFSSKNGNITLQANLQPATSSGLFNGITINGATVESTGSGQISLDGHAGNLTGAFTLEPGVYIENGGYVIGGNGNVQIIGQGGASSDGFNADNHGVYISSGTVTASGTGNVTVQGTGGASAGGNDFGVYLGGTINSTIGSAVITSSGGNVLVTGTGGGSANSGNNFGVYLDAGAVIISGGSGSVTIQATGGTNSTGGDNSGLYIAGNNGVGGAIVGATVTSGAGNVLITATGGGFGNSGSNYGVYVNTGGLVTAGGMGTVTVNGAGGVGDGSRGVWLNGNNATAYSATITSQGGNVQVNGQAGGSGSNSYSFAVYVNAGGVISAGGSGSVTVTGAVSAVAGSKNDGIEVDGAGALITSTNGPVVVTGAGVDSWGVEVGSNGEISAGGSGTVSITGTAQGPGNDGVFVGQGTVTSSGGNIQITGTPAGNNDGINLNAASYLYTPAAGGTITLTADVMNLAGPINAGKGTVNLYTLTSGTPVNIGDQTPAYNLNLSNQQLGYIITGMLNIGNASAGTITIYSPISLPRATNVSLMSGGSIIFNSTPPFESGSLNTDGGALTLTPGGSGAVHPFTAGTDVTVTPAALGFGSGSNLAIAINGTTTQSQYNQLSVLGDVNLTGVNLVLSGSLTPQPGQTFTIVSNQGPDAILGTFNGLPEGAVISHFLGSSLSASISYDGGDGNDVVLTVGSAPPGPISVTASAASSVYGQAVTFTATVTVTNGTPTGSVEFFDETTGADLGAGTLASSGTGTATWTYATTPTQLKVTGTSADVIEGVYTSSEGGAANAATLTGGETVTPLVLTVSGITAANKVYDQTAVATLNLGGAALVGILSGDAVALVTTGATGTFASKNAGNNIAVTVSGLSLTGAQASDYTLVQPILTASIFASAAVLSDSGTTTLTISLGTGQTLTITSTGTSYKFTTNQIFTVKNATDPANQGTILTGVGTSTLTLTSAALIQYRTGILVTDTGPNDSVTFIGSATSVYANNFTVALRNTAAGNITFANNSNFGAFNLQASTTHAISVAGGAILTSTSGNLTLQANQQAVPTSATFVGVTINGSAIQSTGAGLITIQGQGGTAGGADYGVLVENSGTITGGTGLVTVIGTGEGLAAQGNSPGVYLTGGNSAITSLGGNVQITGLGGGISTQTTSNDHGVLIDSGCQASAGGNGLVSVLGTGGQGGGNGVQVSGTITSSGGNVQVVGLGSGRSSFNYGVNVSGGLITAGGQGTVTVSGTGSSAAIQNTSTGHDNYGVNISGTITSSGGDVQVTGTGGTAPGTAADNHGIVLGSSGLVTAGGNGNVTLRGTAGGTPSGSDYGIFLDAANTSAGVSSSGGNVTLIGVGGSDFSGSNNYGLYITSARVSAGGAGTVTILGTGGIRGSGVYFLNPTGAPSAITTSGGNVQITGVAGALSTSATSGVDVEGKVNTPGAGTGVVLSGDSMTLNAALSAGTRNVTLVPKTTGTPINIGNTNIVGTLGLTNAELGHITAGTLQIGGATSGAITISAPIIFPQAANVNLVSGSDIVFNPGSINTAGGALMLAPGATGAVKPLTSGTDANVTPAALGFASGSNLAIAINGTTAQSQYNQLSVLGDVNLTGVNLLLNGTFTPAVGQTFTIVSNQGTHLIVGTFNGLPEGAAIPNFLGSPLSAVISYVGGDANDLVLTVEHPTTTTVTASAVTSTYGQPVTFTATVTSDSTAGVSQGQAGYVEFFDDTTGADLGPGMPVSGTAAWTYTTMPTQLQVTSGPHIIRAVYTGLPGFVGSSGILPSGETVIPAPLTVSGITANDKVYDATTTATLNTTGTIFAGVFAGDIVTFNTSGATGMFAAKDVGNNIPVLVSGLTISGPQAGDYSLIQPTTSANITPATALSLPLPVVGNFNMLEGPSGLSHFNFRVSLPVAPIQAITYDVYTTDGSAVSTGANPNYVPVAAGLTGPNSMGTVTFAPGQIAQTITVTVIAGSLPVSAGSKTFFVNLSNPTTPNVSLATGTGTIIPQNSPTRGGAGGGLPKVLIGNSTMLEGASGLTPFKFQVRLAAASTVPVTYDVYTTDGSAVSTGTNPNFVGIAAGVTAPYSLGTITFAPGQISQTITVYVLAGSIPASSGIKTFTVSMSDPAHPTVALATATGSIIPEGAGPAPAVSVEALDQVFADVGLGKVKM